MKQHLLTDERGFTMIELLVTMVLMGIVMAGIVNMFVSGTRAGADANSRLTSQQNVRLAVGRLEFEGRCATTASIVSSGAGVAFSIPDWCTHASGNVTWCVSGGTLTRYASNACSGTGQVFVTNVTSPTPFTIPTTASGDLPELDIAITVNPGTTAATSATLTDTITLRNAARAS
jgi:prepilin-type N-terminal cleavage/methylation domain-containing protein